MSRNRIPLAFVVLLVIVVVPAMALASGDIVAGQWTWVSGAKTAYSNDFLNTNESYGIYGTKGVPSASNVPGARSGSVSWVDASGNFWLFGGNFYNDGPGIGGCCLINDLWKWNGTAWTWVSGAKTALSKGVYGTKGVPSASNVPGARSGSVSWTDLSGNLWLFGGAGLAESDNWGNNLLNDLWKWNGTAWTWVSGAKTAYSKGVYGTKGVASASNVPGARMGSVSWMDASGNFWLFGGYGYGDIQGDLNDLWKWNGTAWTWISGEKFANAGGVYGTKGVASATNAPGARSRSVSWMDASGNLWLFGGSQTYNGGFENLNDLWKWNGTAWTWISGEKFANAGGVYGTKGVPSASNVPGARSDAVSWTDRSGNLWLFGGNGYIQGPYLNDLWKWNGTAWTWVSGAKTANSYGVHGTKGVASATNAPGARRSSVSWMDASGNLWLFGGYGYAESAGRLNDLWVFGNPGLGTYFDGWTVIRNWPDHPHSGWQESLDPSWWYGPPQGARSGFLFLHPVSVSESGLVRWTGRLTANQLLVTVAGSYGDFIFRCTVNGTVARELVVDSDEWHQVAVDVSRWKGQDVTIDIENVAGGAQNWYFEGCAIDDITFVNSDGILLSRSRVRVSVVWRSQYTGLGDKAFAIPQKDDFAFFYFSDPDNPEVFVKVLDFGPTSPFLLFWAGLTDFEYTVTFENVATGKKVSFLKPAGSTMGGVNTVDLPQGANLTAGEGAFLSLEETSYARLLADGLQRLTTFKVEAQAEAAATQMNLSNGRVAVTATWRNQYSGATGTAFALPQKDEFGFFYFTDAGNPEVFVKVLDFGPSSPFLLFWAGLTDLEYTLTFRNLSTGMSVTKMKPAGSTDGGVDTTSLTKGGGPAAPVAAFTFSPSSPKTGETITFTNQSTGATSYGWDFGDGTTSTSTNPTKSYSSAGPYTVRLTATNASGSNSTSKTVPVQSPAGTAPTAAFTFSPSNPTTGQTITFTNQSTGGATSYAWDFGDGTTSTSTNPTKSYSSAGTYTVRLTATNASGSNSTSKTVPVQASVTTRTMRIDVKNDLVRAVEVKFDGESKGTVSAGNTQGAYLTTTKTTVRVDVETVPATYSNGSLLPGAGQLSMYWDAVAVVDGGQTTLQTAVYFPKTNAYWYAPLVTNNSGVAVEEVVNHKLSDEFRCSCSLAPGTSNVYIGYYRLWSNSTVAVFREGAYPNGSYRYWDNLTSAWSSTSGAVRLTLTTPPSVTAGGLAESVVLPEGEKALVVPAPDGSTTPEGFLLPDGATTLMPEKVQSATATSPGPGAVVPQGGRERP